MTTADSGVQPSPHHCSHPLTGGREGCPRWPACLGAGAPVDEPSALPEDLAALAGFAAAAVLFLAVAALLLPVVL